MRTGVTPSHPKCGSMREWLTRFKPQRITFGQLTRHNVGGFPLTRKRTTFLDYGMKILLKP